MKRLMSRPSPSGGQGGTSLSRLQRRRGATAAPATAAPRQPVCGGLAGRASGPTRRAAWHSSEPSTVRGVLSPPSLGPAGSSSSASTVTLTAARRSVRAVSSSPLSSGSASTTAVPSSLAAASTSSSPADQDAPESQPNDEGRSPSSAAPLVKKARAYADLAKARLSALVVTTAASGYVAASASASVPPAAAPPPLLPPEGLAAAGAGAGAGASASWDLLASFPSPDAASALVLPCLLAGTYLCSASAAALNQILERDRDARMKRTQSRPLVAGTLTVGEAGRACAAWGAAGASLLYLGAGPVAAGLGAANWLLYGVVYTALKPVSPINTWVGAVVGAVPPVMGWSAATSGNLWPAPPGAAPIAAAAAAADALSGPAGGAALEAVSAVAGAVPPWTALALALYWWQLPHFFALSYMHRRDYARGGFRMVSGTPEDEAGDLTARYIVRYTAYLSALPLLTTGIGLTTSMFAVEGLVLNGFALRAALRFDGDRTNANARKVFLTSLWYLPCWLMLFLLHSTGWDEKEDAKGAVEFRLGELPLPGEHPQAQESSPEPPEAQGGSAWERLSGAARRIRGRGRELCLHEAWAASGSAPPPSDIGGGSPAPTRRPDACPIVVGSRKAHEGAESARSAAEAAATIAADATAAGPPLPLAAAAADSGAAPSPQAGPSSGAKRAGNPKA